MTSHSSSEQNSSDEEDITIPYLFKSALDVGSHFIDVAPDNELVFTNNQGTLYTQLTIKNVTNRAHVAYFVFTSAPYPIIIMPKQGFIPPQYQQVVNIGWQNNPDPTKLSHAMFFVKALPISQDMDVDQMNNHLNEVFNTYNLNILFTVYALPCRVSLGFNPANMIQMQQQQFAQQQRPNQLTAFESQPSLPQKTFREETKQQAEQPGTFQIEQEASANFRNKATTQILKKSINRSDDDVEDDDELRPYKE